ncbi:Retrovirus-related Pol polyprotein from type-1 retrotransposable element R1 [Sarcoptes scabiei]|uniref:Retrovirus-related Pol polyprotein from type-1 retrotransposable element R1 n=1 Tax=Sarcoptes scabiei TaxID=52283 RepID=A0A834R9H3_SARSC|nr:Retrovirus-related Pol polyprotein from type-1 retrotransposable element R1 [Sarcoptes scabiei]
MTNKLRIHQQNLRKSSTATQDLLSNLEHSNTDLILIQEPHTNSNNKIMGFPSSSSMYQANSEIIPKTGIFVNNTSLFTKKIEDFSNSWITTIQIHLQQSPLIVSTVYIEPNSISSIHENLVRKLFKTYENVPLIVSGDFNARHTMWHNRITNKHGEVIYEIMNDFDLYLHNDQRPTCLTINGSSIIDLTLTNHKATPFIRNWNSKSNRQSIFDHALIEFDYISRDEIPQRIFNTTRRFNEGKADWGKFRDSINIEELNLAVRNIEHTQNKNKIEHNITKFTKIIQKAASQSMPIIKRSIYHKRSPWWDNELRCMQIVVQNKRYLFTKEKNLIAKQYLYEEYKHFRNKYVRTIRKKKFQQWKVFLEEINTNNTWGNTHKLIKNKLNPKTHTLPIIEDFPPNEHPKIIENIVNNMFPTHTNSPNIEHSTTQESPEQEYNISKEYIENLISKTSKKAPGSDNVTYTMLKAIREIISEPLAKIFSKCLNIGFFPQQWKKASLIIFPKPNKSDYHLHQNYRPISLLSSIGKLLEKILQIEIQNYLIENNKINPNQHGFTPKKSTITALFAIKNKILSDKQHKMTSLITIDFTGAFDNADWNIILNNMHQLQIPQHLIQMMHSYFHHRTITMKYNKIEYSKVMTKGCPQGSPLSPLLWNILINKLLDSFTITNASIYAYADDITVICSSTDLDGLQSIIIESLDFINNFSHQNNLKINFSKTKILNFHKKSFHQPIIIESNTIEIVNKLKILGVIFENHHLKSKINFTSHINSIVNKATITKNILISYCKNTFGIDNRKRKNLFKGLIRPMLTYGSEIWFDQINKSQKKKLESIQHQFLRNSAMAFKTVSKSCINCLTKIETLDTYISIKTMKFLHNNNIQRIDTPNPNLFFKELKKSKLLEIFSQTNQNFQSFFINNYVPKFVHTNYFTTQFSQHTGHLRSISAE